MAAEQGAKRANSEMKFSAAARSTLRSRERDVFNYYDDMGPGRGNCTWGPGILAHRGPCSKAELKKPVTSAAVEAEFASRVAAAERAVQSQVAHQALNQEQYDALVSFTFNMGQGGASTTLGMVDDGDLKGAAANMSSLNKVRVRTKKGTKMVVARGLVTRRAEESAPFRK